MRKLDECGFQLDSQQGKALDLALKGKNLCVLGKAGTGKSVLARAIARHCPDSMALLAPTETGALAIGGESVQRFIYPSAACLGDGAEPLDEQLRDKLRLVKGVVIDDVGILRADHFVALDKCLRLACGGKLGKTPFGGKQIVLVGDFFQANPVSKHIDAERFVIGTHGCLHAFGTPAWGDAEFEFVELDHPYRHANSKDIEILDAVRTGGARWPEIVSSKDIDKALHVSTSYRRHFARLVKRCRGSGTNDDPMELILWGGRDQAEDYNGWELWVNGALGEALHFNGQVGGMFPREALPVDEFLTLRLGCAVTILADDPAGNYVYGEVGVFLGRCGAALKLGMSDGRELSIKAKKWSSYSHELSKGGDGKPSLRKKASGAFVQFPLLAGRSIWLEQAYGRTLPRVQLRCPEPGGDLDDFPVCQLYAGISRTLGLDNLKLGFQADAKEFYADQRVLAFHRELGQSVTSIELDALT